MYRATSLRSCNIARVPAFKNEATLDGETSVQTLISGKFICFPNLTNTSSCADFFFGGGGQLFPIKRVPLCTDPWLQVHAFFCCICRFSRADIGKNDLCLLLAHSLVGSFFFPFPDSSPPAPPPGYSQCVFPLVAEGADDRQRLQHYGRVDGRVDELLEHRPPPPSMVRLVHGERNCIQERKRRNRSGSSWHAQRAPRCYTSHSFFWTYERCLPMAHTLAFLLQLCPDSIFAPELMAFLSLLASLTTSRASFVFSPWSDMAVCVGTPGQIWTAECPRPLSWC